MLFGLRWGLVTSICHGPVLTAIAIAGEPAVLSVLDYGNGGLLLADQLFAPKKLNTNAEMV